MHRDKLFLIIIAFCGNFHNIFNQEMLSKFNIFI